MKTVIPPTPPFWGRREIHGILLSEIIPFINKSALFSGQWRVKRGKMSSEEYKNILNTVLEPKIKELAVRAEKQQLLRPTVVYGYYPCNSDGNRLLVFRKIDSEQEPVIFEFPRQQEPPNLCLADYFKSVSSGEKDVIALTLVTMGAEAARESARLFNADQYQEYLYWHGFSVVCAEALAEYWHQVIRREMGISSRDSLEIKKLFGGAYQGARYSPGYPSCPNLSDQKKIFAILEPESIGVTLTDELQMVPEQSTSAFVVHHPNADYFQI